MLARFGMRFSLPGLVLVLAAACSGMHGKTEDVSTLTIDGEELEVFWNDGDSFKILETGGEQKSVRLMGYNTLENHGPVHRWGDWTAIELFGIANEATAAAAAGEWTCTTDGSLDRYQRSLVTCDDLILYMVETGLGHLFKIDEVANEKELEAQRSAQQRGVGMWAKGLPEFIVTSVHSAAEADDGRGVFNRTISTVDGHSEQIHHEEIYGECQEICLRGSCMVYVPYERRWGEDKAGCLEP